LFSAFYTESSTALKISFQQKATLNLSFKVAFLSFVAKKDTSAYANLMFYSFILRNILSTMCTVADIRWLCYTFNILLPRIQAIY